MFDPWASQLEQAALGNPKVNQMSTHNILLYYSNWIIFVFWPSLSLLFSAFRLKNTCLLQFAGNCDWNFQFEKCACNCLRTGTCWLDRAWFHCNAGTNVNQCKRLTRNHWHLKLMFVSFGSTIWIVTSESLPDTPLYYIIYSLCVCIRLVTILWFI